MAYFAKLDENNIVTEVISVSDSDCLDSNGIEQEEIGVAFCQNLFGGTWRQTSFNRRIRKQFASIGFAYDSATDSFVPPKPYPSWVLDEDNVWRAPTRLALDAEGVWLWSEQNLAWEKQ
jgi:hypothetical protein